MEVATKNLKGMAQQFLQLVTAGEIDKAFERYIGKSFSHHNINFKGDAQSLMDAMKENHHQFPNKIAKIKHTLQDGDMVAIHSHVRMNAEDENGMALVHIFRFENDKVVELWDLGQKVPAEIVNENGMF